VSLKWWKLSGGVSPGELTPPNRRLQPPGRSRDEADYRQFVVFATARRRGYDPIEDRRRANVRATIEAMFEEELAEFLGHLRYGRGDDKARATATGIATES